MMGLMESIVGPKYARAVLRALVAVLLLIALLVLFQCMDRRADRRVSEQAQQGERSAVAINEAAREAVETVAGRSGTENDIDAAVRAAQKEIGNAENSNEVHAAVVRAWCLRPSNRDDAACKVR